MKLNYKTFGAGEPLLILHGLMGMLDNWQSLAKVYAEEFEVFILDARNHGHSEWSDEFNYEVMMYDLLEFCHAQGLSSVHLLGHSMGGKTVMKFAQNFPDFVDKLIVADIGPKQYPVHHQKILAGLTAMKNGDLSSRGKGDKTLAEYVPDAGVRNFLMKSLYWREKGILDLRFNLEAIKSNIVDIGSAVHDQVFEGETLFINGNNSDYVLEEDLLEIQQYFPNMKLHTIENAGHWLHAEQPKEFVEKTISFLNA